MLTSKKTKYLAVYFLKLHFQTRLGMKYLPLKGRFSRYAKWNFVDEVIRNVLVIIIDAEK